jgi:hypothetical protein
MQPITTESEFAEVLQAVRSILFIDFEWSGQARLSAAVINEWERTSNIWVLDCPVFKVRPDELPAVSAWMKAQKARLEGEGGYGSLIWLRAGAIVDYEPYVVGAGLREISRRTRSVFGKKEYLSSAPSQMWDRELDG